MLKQTLKVSMVVALAATVGSMQNAHAAALAGGASDTVKGWSTRTFESIKDMNKLLFIYIYDAKPKSNHFANKLEGKDFLLDAGVAEKLKKFSCIKIQSDDKTLPGEYSTLATASAVVLIMSGDKKHREQFDKNTDTSRISPDYLKSLLDVMIEQDSKLQKEEKAAAKQVADKEKSDPMKDNGGLGNIKGLPVSNNNDDPKKDDKKPGDAKKDDPANPPKKKIVDE